MPSPPALKPLLVATKNAHKTAEIAAILGEECAVSDLTAHSQIASPEETGATFRANAEIKALAATCHFSGLVLADDSGLEVDALDGAPGVHSARYAGAAASDDANRVRLLTELARSGARGRTRSARFRCVMVLAQGGTVLAGFEGTVEGMIVPKERGTGGFGYDALFIPEGECATFAELPSAVKNRLSHRARALAHVLAYLRENRSPDGGKSSFSFDQRC